MSNLIYPLIAAGLSAVGLLLLWLKNRPAPRSPRSSVEDFHLKMRALAPEDSDADPDVGDPGRRV